jgi:hypothetical protein
VDSLLNKESGVYATDKYIRVRWRYRAGHPVIFAVQAYADHNSLTYHWLDADSQVVCMDVAVDMALLNLKCEKT